jgi:methanogenic corrinoid protein MtbC1
VEPQRSETRRRLYSDRDVERLRLLREVTRAGRRIGDLAGMSHEELTDLAREDSRELPANQEPVPAPSNVRNLAGDFLARAVYATERLDVASLQDSLRSASLELGVIELLEGVVSPFLEDVGERWHRGELRIYHEHLASASVRTLLDQLRATLGGDRNDPALIATTPAGQRHELGALTAALLAAAEGWRTTYLGPDMPAREIVAAAKLHGASAVLLSLTYLQDPRATRSELEEIVELLPAGITLVAGGREAHELRPMLEPDGVIVPGDLSSLRAELSLLRRRAVAGEGPVQ